MEKHIKLSPFKITSWLKVVGYIDEYVNPEWNQKHSITTEKGRAIVIYSEERESSLGRNM